MKKLFAFMLVLALVLSLGVPALAAETAHVSEGKYYCRITLDRNGPVYRMYTDPGSPLIIMTPDDPYDDRAGMYSIQYNIFNPEYETRYAPGCPEAEGLYPRHVGISPASDPLSGSWELPAVMNNCHAFSASMEVKTSVGEAEDYDWYVYALAETEDGGDPTIMFSQSVPYFSEPSTLTGSWSFSWGEPDASYPIKGFSFGPMLGTTVEYEQNLEFDTFAIATYDFESAREYMSDLGLDGFLLDGDDELVTSGRIIDLSSYYREEKDWAAVVEEEGTDLMISVGGMDYLLYTTPDCPVWILSPKNEAGEYFLIKYNTVYAAPDASLLPVFKSDADSAVVDYWQLPATLSDCIALYFDAKCNVDAYEAREFNWYSMVSLENAQGMWTAYSPDEFLPNQWAGYLWEPEGPRTVRAFSLAPIRGNSATPANDIDYSLDVDPESLLLITTSRSAAREYVRKLGLGQYLIGNTNSTENEHAIYDREDGHYNLANFDSSDAPVRVYTYEGSPLMILRSENEKYYHVLYYSGVNSNGEYRRYLPVMGSKEGLICWYLKTPARNCIAWYADLTIDLTDSNDVGRGWRIGAIGGENGGDFLIGDYVEVVNGKENSYMFSFGRKVDIEAVGLWPENDGSRYYSSMNEPTFSLVFESLEDAQQYLKDLGLEEWLR